MWIESWHFSRSDLSTNCRDASPTLRYNSNRKGRSMLVSHHLGRRLFPQICSRFHPLEAGAWIRHGMAILAVDRCPRSALRAHRTLTYPAQRPWLTTRSNPPLFEQGGLFRNQSISPPRMRGVKTSWACGLTQHRHISLNLSARHVE
ncbi:uncharacterized protein PV07_02246 [Cladophialophora immunda]|uniref:Uncharacterized protein n=1 Tax=Cladophialophora immunda TaxID=569365 RepID=A0A0D2A5E3_9EURO|nr:uncharacterized protein PV07_02246 [Cladophialophora immunda]KIW35556.1 hypothetical protein PV07_02246 [Cladophialophora immunda]